MSDREPPDWAGDSLSKYFRDAELNDRVTAANCPDVYGLLQRSHAAFEQAEAAIENDSAVANLIPRFLFVRAHSAFLAACRLGMSGQLTEAHAVLRAGVEQAWYALHIAKDPAPFARVELWLRRNESADAAARCKAEFTVGNVRRTHEALDAAAAAQMQDLYEDLIDFGAHPNQLGVLTAIRQSRDENRRNYKVGILHPEILPMMFTLRLVVAVGVGALKIFRLVYPERFALVGLDERIDELVRQLNAVFRAVLTTGFTRRPSAAGDPGR